MHVLVVDDSADVRFMLRVLLEDAGMTVEEVSSGRAGVERLSAPAGIDAVVLDQRMPDLTGVEVAREVRAVEGLPPLILFSAYLHPVLQAEAEDLGVVTCGKTDLYALVDLLREYDGAPV